jgi:hypothetical protein
MITRHQTQYLAWQLASAIVDARIDLNQLVNQGGVVRIDKLVE